MDGTFPELEIGMIVYNRSNDSCFMIRSGLTVKGKASQFTWIPDLLLVNGKLPELRDVDF